MNSLKSKNEPHLNKQSFDFIRLNIKHQILKIPKTSELSKLRGEHAGERADFSNLSIYFNLLALTLFISVETLPTPLTRHHISYSYMGIWLWPHKKSLGSIILLFLYNLKQILSFWKSNRPRYTHSWLFTKHPIKSYLILTLKIPCNWCVKYWSH